MQQNQCLEFHCTYLSEIRLVNLVIYRDDIHRNTANYVILRKSLLMKEDTEKRTKFVKLAEGRVQAALGAIRKIGNLANRRSYNYDDGDVKKILKALKEAVSDLERKFDPSGGPSQKTFKL